MGGCATGPSTSNPRSSSSIITEEELAEVDASTVLEAVRLLRPSWMRFRGAFLDGMPVSPQDLSQEPLGAIGEIRRLTASEAVAKYGVRAVSSYYLEVMRRR
jgi:hypothetical protein